MPERDTSSRSEAAHASQVLTEEKVAFYMKQLGCQIKKQKGADGKASTALLTLRYFLQALRLVLLVKNRHKLSQLSRSMREDDVVDFSMLEDPDIDLEENQVGEIAP